MSDGNGTLDIGDESIELPLLEATVGQPAIDISRLRSSLGHVTFDPGFANTAGTRSSITYINGASGELRHRG